MTPPSSHLVPINGLAYHYLVWGDPKAPPVILLHGLRSYAQTWEPVAQALRGGHLVIAPDFRGRGDSAWDPARDYFADAYVRDVEALVAHLGLSRFAIIGHSMGGTVGYAYAAQHPDQVEALVVEDIGPGSSTQTDGADRILRELAGTPADFPSLDAVRDYWRVLRPDITEEALASRIKYTVRPASSGGWKWKSDMGGIAAARRGGDPGRSIDLWACVEALNCPTLVIRGAQSDFLPVETCVQMAKRQPLLQWAEIDGAGHYAHDDNPAAFVELVSGFLAGIAR